MNKYLGFLCAAFLLGCSDFKQKESVLDAPVPLAEELPNYSNALAEYDSLLSKYGIKEFHKRSLDIKVEMVIAHASVGSFFVYNLLGNDSTMRVKLSIVNESEVVMLFEKLLWEEEAIKTTDSLGSLLSISSFWELDNDKVDCEGADGTTYLLKVRQGEMENQILRWSPEICELPKGKDILQIVDYLLSIVKIENFETKYFR